jgi:hypothetical protein
MHIILTIHAAGGERHVVFEAERWGKAFDETKLGLLRVWMLVVLGKDRNRL